MRILLITGGWSAERQVALNGAQFLQKAMQDLGHVVEWYDLQPALKDFAQAVGRNDFAFINLHGSPGEDGLVQAMLEQFDTPYQGSGPGASMLALDKATAKSFFRNAGLKIANSLLLTEKPGRDWRLPLQYPVFIKDNRGGSTLNLEYVPDEEHLFPALDRLFAKGTQFLAEEAVTGAELTCGVYCEIVDGVEVPLPLPPVLIEVKTGTGLFDYESKYSADGAKEICPAPIADAVTEKMQKMAVTAHNALGLSGYSRADFIVPSDGEPVILEVNTLPGMTGRSLIPQEFAAIGIDYAGMVEHLIHLGLERKGKKG